MSKPEVCIIVLNWNGLADTRECLQSLQQLAYPSYHVVVVDNGSVGDDVAVLRDSFAGYADIVSNHRNDGFAEGNNSGIRYCLEQFSPDYIFLLNNDTTVAADFLDELISAMEKSPSMGIAGPKIYYYDFDNRKDVIWAAGGKVTWWHPWVYDGIGCNRPDGSKYGSISEVDWVSGAAMLIRRQVIEELGMLDSGYFFGNEDVEYCLRARKKGHKCVYVPRARIWHKVGKSRQDRGPMFADLFPYYRLIRRNFPPTVYAYQLLMLSLLVVRRVLYRLFKL